MLIRCLKCKKIVKNRQMCDLGPDSPAGHRTQSSPVHGVRQMFRNRTCPVYGVRQTFRNQTCPVYGVRQMFRDRTCPVSGIRQIFKHRTCPVSGVRRKFHVRSPTRYNGYAGMPMIHEDFVRNHNSCVLSSCIKIRIMQNNCKWTS